MNKLINKHALYFIMVVLIAQTLVIPTFAETSETTPVSLTSEPAILSVTVPTSLPVSIDNQGNGGTDSLLITHTNVCPKMINNSFGPIKVVNAEISAINGWTTVDYTTNMKYEKVNTKKVAASIILRKPISDGHYLNVISAKTLNDNTTSYAIKCGEENNFIDGAGGYYVVQYGIKIPARSIALVEENVVSVIFTVSWNT